MYFIIENIERILVAQGTEGALPTILAEFNFSFCRPNTSHILLHMKLKPQLHSKWPNDKNVTPIKVLSCQICFNRMRLDRGTVQGTLTSNSGFACVS
jgi:hypothetical protein